MQDIKGPLKRGRGRPRVTDSQELLVFDKKLVEEYRKRTDLYDPKSPMFRNKAFYNQLWEEMASAMKSRSSVIKDRMTHLRQRYTKERRYLEVQQQQNGAEVISSWALYDDLAFLNDFIRQRATSPPTPITRPKRLKRLPQNIADNDQNEQDESEDEEEDEDDEEVISVPPTSNSNQSQSNTSNHEPSSNQRPPPAQFAPQNFSVISHNISMSNNTQKLKAFGDFLAYSLLDLDESRALPLVSQFTNELVKAMVQNN